MQIAEIIEQNWNKAVKKSKKQSTLSIFSNQTYIFNKFNLKYKNFTKMLLNFYNTVIKN